MGTDLSRRSAAHTRNTGVLRRSVSEHLLRLADSGLWGDEVCNRAPDVSIKLILMTKELGGVG